MKTVLISLTILLLPLSFVCSEDITKTKTVKAFLKSNTDLRVADEAAEAYKNSLNKISVEVIKKATELAKNDNRKTILKRDMGTATELVFRKAPMSVEELMEKIKLLSIIDLADLSNKVKTYGDELLEDQKKKTKKK